MMDEKRRRNWGFAGSAIIHVLIFLIVSLQVCFNLRTHRKTLLKLRFSVVVEAEAAIMPVL